MKHVLTMIGVALLLSSPALACDVCGCGVGSPYAGLSPYTDRSAIGVRLRYSFFESHLTYGERFRSTEQFIRSELWTRWTLAEHWQITATVPWSSNMQRMTMYGTTVSESGLGDVTAGLNYVLSSSEDEWRSSLVAGAGVSIPTGTWRFRDTTDQVANANFQLGTGSVDAMLSMIGTLRTTTLGFQLGTVVRIPTANPDGYRFGTSAAITGSVFHLFPAGSMTFIPSVSATYETAAMNTSSGDVIDVTGGHVLFLGAGVDIVIDPVMITISTSMPIDQNLGGGALRTNPRLTGGISVLL